MVCNFLKKMRKFYKFFLGAWKSVLELIQQYIKHYKRLVMYSGPIFDRDNNGRADKTNNNFENV